jgi:hypothetical protein
MSKFGWVKDKYDPRDHYFKAVLQKVPKEVNWEDYLPNVRNQGNEGSCVGFGVGVNITSVAIRQGVYTEWFSPRWIYNGARALEDRLDEEGAYPRDAFEFLLSYGCLLEQYWKYLPWKDSHKDPREDEGLKDEASQYPVLEYVRVVDGVDGICQALAEGHLVSIGSPWYRKWVNPRDKWLEEPNMFDMPVGGHETCLYGYDIEKAVFYLFNSWGNKWAYQGTACLPFKAIDVFKWHGGYDAHYPVIKWVDGNGPNPPEPEPQPKICDILDGVEILVEQGMDVLDFIKQVYGCR